MLKSLPRESRRSRLQIGSKKLSLDPTWSRPVVAEIEMALLRAAVFPDLSKATGLQHEFVILDPSTRADTPDHEDLVERIVAAADRMKIGTMVMGHQSSLRFGGGGFRHTTKDLETLGAAEFSLALADLRERIGWVVKGSRFNQSRHIFVPQFDFAILAVVIELLSQLPPDARPFVHLATRHDESEIANRRRFGALARFGQAIQELNTDRPRLFLYAWSSRLAQRLSMQSGIGVQPLDGPTELTLTADPPEQPERLTVGYFSSTSPGSGAERLETLVRATNQTAGNARRVRFVIQLKPDSGSGVLNPVALAQKAKLAAIADRNVVLIEEHLPRTVYLNTLAQVDAVLILRPGSQTAFERISMTAHHAMAAGKLILTLDDVELAGTVKARVIRARDLQAMGEIIGELSGDLSSVRTAARVARATHAATLRPSRLFAQLLYGPLILANAAGHDAI